MSESNWYEISELEEKKKPLDYSKPIIAEVDGDIFLLSPIHKTFFDITGWNWLNLRSGKFRSNGHWESPRSAVTSYEDLNPRNVDLYQLIKDAEK